MVYLHGLYHYVIEYSFNFRPFLNGLLLSLLGPLSLVWFVNIDYISIWERIDLRFWTGARSYQIYHKS